MHTKRHLLLLIALLILPGIVLTAVASQEPQSTAMVCGVDTWDYETLYDFEADDGGFVANTPPGEWAWGDLQTAPDAPPAAHSGAKLWATNLAGNITSQPSRHLLSKTVTLSTFSAGQLQWWDWWHEDGTDQGRVWINGEEVYFVDANQLVWTVHQVDLTPWQGQTVDIVFDYFAYPSMEGGAGWYIDDVALQTCDPTATPDLQFSRMIAPETAITNVPIDYTVTLFNSGEQDAVGSSLIDDLPAGTTYVTDSATNGATYNAAAHQIEWSGTVPGAETVDIAFQIIGSTAVTLTNTATINHPSLSEPLILTADTQVAQAAEYPMFEGFESGSWPPTMLAQITTNGIATGRAVVSAATAYNTPYEGDYDLGMDTDCGGLCGVGTFTTQAAILAADLTGQSQVGLTFQIFNHLDEAHPQDGVFISDDSGKTYVKAYDFAFLPNHYQHVTIDLSRAASDAGLTLNNAFMIKFQSYDNDRIDRDGYSLDNIEIKRLDRPELSVAPSILTSKQTPDTQQPRPLTLNNSGAAPLTWILYEIGSTFLMANEVEAETAVGQPISILPEAAKAELNRQEEESIVVRPLDDLLYDQSDNVTSLSAVNSQQYEEAFATSTNQAADDFVVPVSDGSWTIRTVEAIGSYQSGPGITPYVNIYFYTDANGLPGAAIYSATGLTSFFDYDGTLLIDLPMPALLPPGTYWVSVQADMDFDKIHPDVGGQWMWHERTQQTGSEFAWRNPGGDIEGRDCLTWGSSSTCNFDRPDLGFRLAGTRGDCIPQDISWLSVAEHAGNTAADSIEKVNTTFDSTGLSFGEYNGELCLISNDPVQPVKTIPLQMTVQESVEYLLFLPTILQK